MRRILDALYDGAVWLAAVMMVGVLVMVLLSIAGRQLHFHVPGTDAYAGYLMAGAGFLALAHTLRRGEHIRVTLLIQALRGAPRRALEVWSLSVATLLASAFAFYAIKLTWESRVFNDVSTSSDATPLWIPQLSMAAGAVLLVVALLDEWVQTVRGREIARATDAEPLRNE